MYMYVKRAMYGYENILYLETQVLNAISMPYFYWYLIYYIRFSFEAILISILVFLVISIFIFLNWFFYSLNYIGGLHEAFPQVIYYDGKNLIQTPLCTTWYQYIYSEFYAGGLSLESGYNFMLEMVTLFSTFELSLLPSMVSLFLFTDGPSVMESLIPKQREQKLLYSTSTNCDCVISTL